ncbi:MAG: NUDIX hydrolase [Bacilli bacterium]|nr:NUDIX hydrolase [Bacilli bacterium]
MRQIVINENNLTDEDIELNVVRVKALLINSQGKILLAHNNNTYQFPGGHVEEDESMDKCIEREVKEETGINVYVKEKPFLSITTYDGNYFNTNKKVRNSIYYYRFFTDKTPNFEETHYDELELETEFNLFYVNFKDLENFLTEKIQEETIDKKIGIEMLYVVEEYNKLFGGLE